MSSIDQEAPPVVSVCRIANLTFRRRSGLASFAGYLDTSGHRSARSKRTTLSGVHWFLRRRRGNARATHLNPFLTLFPRASLPSASRYGPPIWAGHGRRLARRRQSARDERPDQHLAGDLDAAHIHAHGRELLGRHIV